MKHISQWAKVSRRIPLFKKADPFGKTNYRQVSLLCHISKVFKIIIYNQIDVYIEPFPSKLLTVFCKNYDTQHLLLKMVENCKKVLNKGNSVSAIFVDLPKAFDTLIHDLIIAKIKA